MNRIIFFLLESCVLQQWFNSINAGIQWSRYNVRTLCYKNHTWKMVCNIAYISVNVFLLWQILYFSSFWFASMRNEWVGNRSVPNAKKMIKNVWWSPSYQCCASIWHKCFARITHTHTHTVWTRTIAHRRNNRPNESLNPKHRKKKHKMRTMRKVKNNRQSHQHETKTKEPTETTEQKQTTKQNRPDFHSAIERDDAFPSIRNKRCKQ